MLVPYLWGRLVQAIGTRNIKNKWIKRKAWHFFYTWEKLEICLSLPFMMTFPEFLQFHNRRNNAHITFFFFEQRGREVVSSCWRSQQKTLPFPLFLLEAEVTHLKSGDNKDTTTPRGKISQKLKISTVFSQIRGTAPGQDWESGLQPKSPDQWWRVPEWSVQARVFEAQEYT